MRTKILHLNIMFTGNCPSTGQAVVLNGLQAPPDGETSPDEFNEKYQNPRGRMFGEWHCKDIGSVLRIAQQVEDSWVGAFEPEAKKARCLGRKYHTGGSAARESERTLPAVGRLLHFSLFSMS